MVEATIKIIPELNFFGESLVDNILILCSYNISTVSSLNILLTEYQNIANLPGLR